MDCRARSTASRPESVHSARIPTRVSSFATLSQVLKSSSTTSALRPASSAIFSSRRLPVCTRSGRQMINSVPRFFSVCTLIVPPIISTMFRVMAMPRPVPCIRLTVEVRSRSNGSKIFCANSGLMPMPLSRTRNSYCAQSRTVPASCRIRTETVPPAGVNLMALDSRLSRICPIRVRSQ